MAQYCSILNTKIVDSTRKLLKMLIQQDRQTYHSIEGIVGVDVEVIDVVAAFCTANVALFGTFHDTLFPIS